MGIPTGELEEAEDLDQTFEQDEIYNSIIPMQSGKTPGPDGYLT